MIWRYYIQPALRRPLSDWTQYPLFGIAAFVLSLVATSVALILSVSGRSDSGAGWYTAGINILVISTFLDFFPTVGIVGRWLFLLPGRAFRFFRNL